MTNLTICTGISCKSKAAGLLVKKAEQKLNCYVGELSEDQKIRLTNHECLGNCTFGPSIRLDCYILPQISEKEIELIIDSIQTDDKRFIKSITEFATLDLSQPLAL